MALKILGRRPPNAKDVLHDPSAWGIVLANLSFLAMALFFEWDFSVIIYTFLMQSVVLWFFLSLKLFNAKREDAFELYVLGERKHVGRIPSLALNLFFGVVFHYIYFLVLVMFFSVVPPVQDLLVGAFPFLAAHSYSFAFHKNHASSKNIVSMQGMLSKRLVPLHLFLTLGVFLMGKAGFASTAGRAGLTLFLLIKTFVDTYFHATEHKRGK